MTDYPRQEILHAVWQCALATCGVAQMWMHRRQLAQRPDDRVAWEGPVGPVGIFVMICGLFYLMANGMAMAVAKEIAPSVSKGVDFFNAAATGVMHATLAGFLLFMRRFVREFSPPTPHRVSPKGPFGFTLPGLGRAFVGAIAVVTLSSVVWRYGFLVLLKKFFPGDYDAPQEAVRLIGNTNDPALLAVMTLGAVVFAPMSEELFFRAAIFPAFRARLPRLAAYAGVGLFFGVAHFNIAALLPLAAFGAWLAWLYDTTADIRVPIVTHALFNLSNIGWLRLGVE